MIATLKQVNCIKFIEHYTKYEFEGFNTEEASDFIARYLEEAITESTKPTDKQRKCAYAICQRQHITHNCLTKSEYSAFIADHTDPNWIR